MSENTMVSCIKCKHFSYSPEISLFGTGLCHAPIPAKCGPEDSYSMSMLKDIPRVCPAFKKGKR